MGALKCRYIFITPKPINMCVYIYIYMYIYIYKQAEARARMIQSHAMDAYKQTDVQRSVTISRKKFIHAYIHTYIHTELKTYPFMSPK